MQTESQSNRRKDDNGVPTGLYRLFLAEHNQLDISHGQQENSSKPLIQLAAISAEESDEPWTNEEPAPGSRYIR